MRPQFSQLRRSEQPVHGRLASKPVRTGSPGGRQTPRSGGGGAMGGHGGATPLAAAIVTATALAALLPKRLLLLST